MTKYLEDDYDSLCRKNFHSGMDQFYDYIIKELSSGVSRKDVFRSLIQKDYKGGQTAAYDYMNKIIERFHIDIAEVLRLMLFEKRKSFRNMTTYQEMVSSVFCG